MFFERESLNKRKWLHMKKKVRRKYLAETTTHKDTVDYLWLHANKPAQVKPPTAVGITLYVNPNKIVDVFQQKKNSNMRNYP